MFPLPCYDAAGDVASVTDAVGDTTTYTYDPMGRLLTEQNPVQAAAGKCGIRDGDNLS